jgi:mRNA-degrading endonuclease RelE of RelBE toxin-antitoxin system
MTYRLLIDYEALDVLASLKKPVQRLVHQRLRQIQEFPSHWADYQERDPSGRALHVSIVGDYAITYWEDFADRHVKVLEIARADR